MQFYSFRNVADAIFLFVALALAVASFLLITSTLVDHLRNYRYPALQTCCMRILLLAPIYALVSWCMMVFLPISAYIEIFRDIYEAYTLYCFWVMLVLWCGGQRRVIEIVDRQESVGCYLCPLVEPCGCGLPVYRFRNSTNLFRYLRFAIMQMMLVKPAAGLLVAALASSGRPPGHPHARHARTAVLISTATAMHSIFTLYMATKPYMRGLNASRKFLSIKVVVAIILLQQLAINTLLSADIIPEGRLGYTIRDHAQRIMGTITIIEMAVFSLLLSYVFSHTSIGRPDTDDGGMPRAPGDLSASRRGSTNEVFELVMGDASAAAHARKGAPLSSPPEAVSLWSVFSLWDVLVMPRVEEASMQCAAPGVPVELVDLEGAESVLGSVLGSVASLDTPNVLELADMQPVPRPHLASPSVSRPRISQSV
eukprot:jgi/Ulvmu1/6097/UM027_0075.1